jgi:hypothetical protein
MTARPEQLLLEVTARQREQLLLEVTARQREQLLLALGSSLAR